MTPLRIFKMKWWSCSWTWAWHHNHKMTCEVLMQVWASAILYFRWAIRECFVSNSNYEKGLRIPGAWWGLFFWCRTSFKFAKTEFLFALRGTLCQTPWDSICKLLQLRTLCVGHTSVTMSVQVLVKFTISHSFKIAGKGKQKLDLKRVVGDGWSCIIVKHD